MDVLITKDDTPITVGEVAWNYYDGHAVLLSEIDHSHDEPWGTWHPIEPCFEHSEKEVWKVDFLTKILLNSERVCSVQMARHKDWTTDSYPNEGQ